MIASHQIRSSATKDQYAGKYRQIRARIARLDGLPDASCVTPTRIVRHLIESKPALAKSTWTYYRCAVRDAFQTTLQQTTDQDLRAAYELALAALEAERQTGARSRGSRTSALKIKTIAPEDVSKLVIYLRDRNAREPLAMQLLAFLVATVATGLRPCEWANARLVSTQDATTHLIVKNAKATNGRANGETRTLVLHDLTPLQTQAIKAMTHVVACIAQQPGGYAAWQARLRPYLRRSARAALGKRARLPALSTCRHQFSANAKSMLTQEEVAAMMGHVSDATAGRHYAKARQARGGVGVRPVAAEVQTVRRVAGAQYAARGARLRR